jgi:ADP-ribose pyrophosphatase YjhB (NUDIX family)
MLGKNINVASSRFIALEIVADYKFFINRLHERSVTHRQYHMPHRIAARAIIIENDKILLVNAFADTQSDLWCAPGGGAEMHSSLPENLAREVFEETGLMIEVGAPCLVNEFHNEPTNFHQIEIFFRCTLISGKIDHDWQDPENIVTKRRFFTQDEMKTINFKPSSLPDIAFSTENAVQYDALEPIVWGRADKDG